MTLIRNKQIIIDSDWSLNGMHLTNAPDPTADDHVANKAYVDSVAAGLDPKASVRFAAIGNITGFTSDTFPIGGTSWTHDGLTAQDDDRVLVKDQTDATQNGIYTVSGVGTSVVLTRSSDFDGTPAHEVSAGNYTFVETGSLGGTGWVVLGDGVLDVNTDPIVWSQFSESTSFTAGDAIDLTSGTIDVLYDNNTIKLSGNELYVDKSALNILASEIGGLAAFIDTQVFQTGNFEDGLTIDFTVTPGDKVTAEVIDGTIGVSKLNTSGTQAPGSILIATTGDDLEWADINDILPTPTQYNGIGAIDISGNDISVLYDNDTIKLDTGTNELYVDETQLSLVSSQITDLVSTINSTVFQQGNFIDTSTIGFLVGPGDVSAIVLDDSIGANKLNTTGTKGPNATVLMATFGDELEWVNIHDLLERNEVEKSGFTLETISSGTGILSNNRALNLGHTLKANSFPELYLNGVKYKLGQDPSADAWLADDADINTPLPFVTVNDQHVLVWSVDNSGVAIDGQDEIIFKYTAA